MSYIGNSPGLAKRQLFRYIATAGQVTFSGVDANGMTMNYTPGLQDVFMNGWYIPPANYTATNGSSIVFSSALSAGDEVSVSAAGAYNPADTLSLSQNGLDILDKTLFRQSIQTPTSGPLTGYVFNPSFEISQQNGDNVVNINTNATSIYGTDQWMSSKNGTVVFTSQKSNDNLSGYANYRSFRNGQIATITTAQASFAVGEYAIPLYQYMEGTFIKNLAWGTGDAKSIDVVFIVTSSVSGTYSLSIKNGASNRSYVTTFALVANTPTLVFKTIPGDTSGTWPSDISAGMVVTVGAVSGTTFQAPTLDAWGAGNYISHSTCTNWAATNGAGFVVNYLNFFTNGILPYTSTNTTGLLGILSNLRRPYDEELMRCKRYFQIVSGALRFMATGAGQVSNGVINLTPVMRAAPTATATGSPLYSANSLAMTLGSPSTSDLYTQISSSASGDAYVVGQKFTLNSRM